MAEKSINPKVKGKVVWSDEGIEISVLPLKAKRTGKDRFWIQIRQTKPPKYQVDRALIYAYNADIQFVESATQH